MTNRRKNDESFHNVISQSQSDDDLHLHSNSNINDCNLLLNNKKHPDSSIFDDSSLASVSYSRINQQTNFSLQVFPLAVH